MASLSMASRNSIGIFSFRNPRPQSFPFSYSIMKYMCTNLSSGKAWKKLIQTCKYFFSKNDIYPVLNLRTHRSDHCNFDKKFINLKERLSLIPKIWPSDKFRASSNLISKYISKFYKFDLKCLVLYLQRLTWQDYQILTSSGSLEHLEILSSTIKYSDGTMVTFDKLLQNLYYIQKIKIELKLSEDISFFKVDTVKNMLKFLPNCKNLRKLHLIYILEDFDFLSFMDYILGNENVEISIAFDYNIPLSEIYIQMLHNFIDKILKNPPKRIPEINYLDLEGRRYYDYQRLRRGYTL